MSELEEIAKLGENDYMVLAQAASEEQKAINQFNEYMEGLERLNKTFMDRQAKMTNGIPSNYRARIDMMSLNLSRLLTEAKLDRIKRIREESRKILKERFRN